MALLKLLGCPENSCGLSIGGVEICLKQNWHELCGQSNTIIICFVYLAIFEINSLVEEKMYRGL